MKPWQTLSRRKVLDYSKFLSVESHTVALPNGRVISEWPWVITPDYVNIAVITKERTFLCFRQTKYAVADTTLAPVGGYVEAGEVPLVAAKRELLEETGYEADRWVPLGHYAVDGNRGAGRAHLYLALDASPVAERDADDLEEQVLLELTREEVEAALQVGEFKVLAWTAVMALALQAI